MIRRFIILLALAAVFLGIGRSTHLDPAGITSYLRGFPLGVSGAVFIGLYVVSTFFIWVGPKDILRVVAAAVYGPWISTLFVWGGEMGNLLTMFSLSRRLGRGFVEQKLVGKMERLDQVVAGETRAVTVLFLRAFPVVPFRFLDLGFGLTGMPLKKYFLLSCFGSLPRIFFLQFYLSLGTDLILDSQKMTAYLTAHPQIALASMAYAVTALGMLVMMACPRRRTPK